MGAMLSKCEVNFCAFPLRMMTEFFNSYEYTGQPPSSTNTTFMAKEHTRGEWCTKLIVLKIFRKIKKVEEERKRDQKEEEEKEGTECV